MHDLQNVFVSYLIRHWVHRFDLPGRTSVLRIAIQTPIVVSQVVIRLVGVMLTVSNSAWKPSGRASTLGSFPK